MKKIALIILGILVLGFLFINIVGKKETQVGTQVESQATFSGNGISQTKKVKLGKISSSAEIIYHSNGYIYTMDSSGGNVERVTFDTSRPWEHVAVSPDHRFIVAATHSGPEARVWLFDLEAGTESQVLSEFKMAGDGGVDWDREGYMYFAAKEKDVVANPKKAADFIANVAAEDVYKIKYDGTGLTQLTFTKDAVENDVSVNGGLVTFIKGVIESDGSNHLEVWTMSTDGSNPRLIYKAGAVKVASAHDPETSPDNTQAVFSKVNTEVAPNFPNDPNANTAHDLWIINTDGTGLRRLTPPGPISIAPDWKGNKVIYLEISDKDNINGISIINTDGSGHKMIKPGGQFGKWIP